MTKCPLSLATRIVLIFSNPREKSEWSLSKEFARSWTNSKWHTTVWTTSWFAHQRRWGWHLRFPLEHHWGTRAWKLLRICLCESTKVSQLPTAAWGLMLVQGCILSSSTFFQKPLDLLTYRLGSMLPFQPKTTRRYRSSLHWLRNHQQQQRWRFPAQTCSFRLHTGTAHVVLDRINDWLVSHKQIRVLQKYQHEGLGRANWRFVTGRVVGNSARLDIHCNIIGMQSLLLASCSICWRPRKQNNQGDWKRNRTAAIRHSASLWCHRRIGLVTGEDGVSSLSDVAWLRWPWRHVNITTVDRALWKLRQ